jgi:dCTP deaminase
MSFWSSETVKDRVHAEKLIKPFDPTRVMRGAYELSAGSEAYVTSKSGENTKLGDGERIIIPPGQFGLLLTKETVTVPSDAIAFISIKSTTKLQGLVNVSGFHVDPGYSNTLKFAVYNAGPQNIFIDQNQPVFLIWYAGLDCKTKDLYVPRPGLSSNITAEDVKRIEGNVASPAELKRQLDVLKNDFERRVHKLETDTEERIHRIEASTDKRAHTIETKQGVVQGLLLAGVIAFVGSLIKSGLESSNKAAAPPPPASATATQKAPSTSTSKNNTTQSSQRPAPAPQPIPKVLPQSKTAKSPADTQINSAPSQAAP